MTTRTDPAIYVLEDRLEQLRQETSIIELAISALLALSVDDAPIASTAPGAGSDVPATSEPAPTGDELVECDECGETFHRQGIGPHRRKHRSFDPDQARAAAAAAI